MEGVWEGKEWKECGREGEGWRECGRMKGGESVGR